MQEVNEFRWVFRKKSYLPQPSMMMRVLSVYCRIKKSLEWCNSSGRFSKPWSFALLMIDCKRFVANTNKCGDKGSPCLTALLQWNNFARLPFRRTKEVPVLTLSFIQAIHLAPEPLFSIMFSIAQCSIMSRSFSKSNVRITNSFLDF